jgi:hypothetical protein
MMVAQVNRLAGGLPRYAQERPIRFLGSFCHRVKDGQTESTTSRTDGFPAGHSSPRGDKQYQRHRMGARPMLLLPVGFFCTRLHANCREHAVLPGRLERVTVQIFEYWACQKAVPRSMWDWLPGETVILIGGSQRAAHIWKRRDAALAGTSASTCRSPLLVACRSPLLVACRSPLLVAV